MEQQKKPTMFSGRYRTGLTQENVGLYLRVVMTLLRCESQGEGILANRVRENLGSVAWNECIVRLADWGLVEFEPACHGRARVVALSESASSAQSNSPKTPLRQTAAASRAGGGWSVVK